MSVIFYRLWGERVGVLNSPKALYYSNDLLPLIASQFSILSHLYSTTDWFPPPPPRSLCHVIPSKSSDIQLETTILRKGASAMIESIVQMWMACQTIHTCACSEKPTYYIQTRLQDWAVNFTVFNTTNVIPSNQKICLVTFYLKQLLYAMNIYHSRDSCSPESKTFSISWKTNRTKVQNWAIRGVEISEPAN